LGTERTIRQQYYFFYWKHDKHIERAMWFANLTTIPITESNVNT
jgi:hypothetical protein